MGGSIDIVIMMLLAGSSAEHLQVSVKKILISVCPPCSRWRLASSAFPERNWACVESACMLVGLEVLYLNPQPHACPVTYSVTVSENVSLEV